MILKEPHQPKYRHHKASGRAVVTLSGEDIYLGKYDTPESYAEYDRRIGEWMARGRRPAPAPEKVVLLKEVIAGYFDHAKKTMKPLEVEKVRDALKVIRSSHGERPAAEFNGVSFLAVRAKLVDSGLCITTIRNRLFVIKKMLAWGIVREMVPDRVLNIIKATEKVEPLKLGQPGVKAPKEVKPAPLEHIKAILPHVSPVVATMLMVQLHSAARPGEICRMTCGQIDTSGDVWIYRPTQHKTKHHGKSRAIALGPEAQAILRPWLRPDDPDAPLFPPKAGYEHGHKLTGKKARTFKPTYDKGSYAQAVVRGCDRAGVPVFRPNRVRHTAATEIRRVFGLEAAQVALGHHRADTTQIYAERNLELAMDVARKRG